MNDSILNEETLSQVEKAGNNEFLKIMRENGWNEKAAQDQRMAAGPMILRTRIPDGGDRVLIEALEKIVGPTTAFFVATRDMNGEVHYCAQYMSNVDTLRLVAGCFLISQPINEILKEAARKSTSWSTEVILLRARVTELANGIVDLLQFHSALEMTREKALEIVDEWINEDGSFWSLGHFIGWHPGDEKIILDAEFSVEELEALAWLMRNSTEENPVVP